MTPSSDLPALSIPDQGTRLKWRCASSMSAISTSTANAQAQLSVLIPSAASTCPAQIRRRAAPITCCCFRRRSRSGRRSARICIYPCGSDTPVRPTRLFPQYELRNRRKLHVRCALVNLADLCIAPILLYGIVFRKPSASINFNRKRRHTFRYLRAEEFRHGVLFHKWHAGIFHARSVVDHQPRRFDLSRHLRQLKLNSLKFGNALAELLALLRVLGGVLPCPTRHTQHLRANADAAFVQSFNRDLVALADFAQHVILRNPAVFQNQFARGRSANPEFVFLLSNCETGEFFLNNKSRNSLVSRRWINGCKQHKDSSLFCIGDPKLAAVQNVIASLQLRPGLERECIRARTGLTQRIRSHCVCGHARQIFLLLLGIRPAQQRIIY